MEGSPLYNPRSAIVFLAIQTLKGITDIGRVGIDAALIPDQLRAAAQNGEFEAAISNYVESFKNAVRMGLNPLVAATPVGANTPNLNAALAGAGREGLRIWTALSFTGPLTSAAKLAASEVKSVFQMVRTGFAAAWDDILRATGVDLAGERGFTRIVAGSADDVSRFPTTEIARDAYASGKITAEEARRLFKVRNGSSVNADFIDDSIARGKPLNQIQRPWNDLDDDILEYAMGGDQFKNLNNDPLVKVFTSEIESDTGIGRWVTRRSVIQGKTPAQIKQLLALEKEPTHFVEFVPDDAATLFIRDGKAGQNAWGTGGGQQYQIISNLKEDWFKNIKAIGDIFNG